MKVLVTGAAGQLAREVVRQCEALGHSVSAPVRAELDICDFGSVTRLLADVEPEAVINCAAFNDVDGSEEQWREALLVNGVGVRNLANAAGALGAVLVHFSTDYVFDGNSTRPYTIADETNPISMYGRSKLLGERCLMEHAGRFFLIRTSWVFGDGKNSFPKKLKEWASKSDSLRMVDDQVSCPTYSADLAAAALRLLDSGSYGLYHVSNSGHASRYEWAAFVLKLMGWEGRLEPAKSAEFNSPAARPRYSVLDNFPLEETIGGLLPAWQDATERFFLESAE
jgi:dTDP-4-dehydrorhamnose reductase